jgi:hypothetical protein
MDTSIKFYAIVLNMWILDLFGRDKLHAKGKEKFRGYFLYFVLSLRRLDNIHSKSCCFVDFWEDFDYVLRDSLFQRLCDINISVSLITTVMRLYDY